MENLIKSGTKVSIMRESNLYGKWCKAYIKALIKIGISGRQPHRGY